jgi:glycosyltransferase involved in cell wall biosynthesis
MNSLPDVTVVMSVYNGADRLRETVESVLSQQGVSLEFIIIDDGST